MTSNTLSELEYSDKARKRATWEAFEFDVPASGLVVVTNASYGDEKEEHRHTVNVEDDVPVGCSCKSDKYQSGACKHRVAVAIAAPVLEAASASRSAGKRALADGGTIAAPEPQGSEAEDDEDEVKCLCEMIDEDELGCFEHFEVSDR